MCINLLFFRIPVLFSHATVGDSLFLCPYCPAKKILWAPCVCKQERQKHFQGQQKLNITNFTKGKFMEELYEF